MAVSSDILRTWRNPRAVMRGLLDMGRREDRALMIVMVGCFLIFIAQWPRLSRTSAGFGTGGGDAPELSQLVAYEFFAWLLIWPLLLYFIGSVLHVIAKAAGGKGSFYSARLALFWAVLATTPAALLYGLCAGFLGPVLGTQITGLIYAAAFFAIFGACFYEAEKAAEGTPHV